MKKKLVIALVILLLCLGGWYLLKSSVDSAADGLVLHGNVDIRQVSLAFNGSGRVGKVLAEEGDLVEAGDILAKLDVEELSLQAAQASAAVEVQRQVLTRLQNGTRPEEISQARSRLEAAKAEEKRAGDEVERLRNIAEKTSGRGVSEQDVDRAIAAKTVASARVKEQREALKLAEIGPRVEDIAAAKAQLKASQAQLALLEYRISQGDLRSPSTAVVRSRLAEPGDMVSPPRTVFTLALSDPKWVRVYVSEPSLGRVKPGMSASILTDSYPDQPVKGRVGYISSVAEFTPKAVQTEELRTSLVYEVRVVVADAENRLRLGQPVTVRLESVEAE